MIFLHELGHFLTAKRAGMKVTEFFLGFGPRLWSFQRGETEYGVKAIPAGAYVRIIGMNNLEEVPPEDEARTYRQGLLVAAVGGGGRFDDALPASPSCCSSSPSPSSASSARRPPGTVGRGIADDQPGVWRPASSSGDQRDRLDGIAGDRRSTSSPTQIQLPARPDRDAAGPAPDGSTETLTANLDVAQPAGRSRRLPRRSAQDQNVRQGSRSPAGRRRLGARSSGASRGRRSSVSGTVFSPERDPQLRRRLHGNKPATLDASGSATVRHPGDRHGGRRAPRLADRPPETRRRRPPDPARRSTSSLGIFNLIPLLPLDGGHVAIATYETLRSRKGQPVPGRRDQALPLTLQRRDRSWRLLFVAALYLDIARPASEPVADG